MTDSRVFITGIGILSPVAGGLPETRQAVKNESRGIKSLTLFAVPHNALPVGEISLTFDNDLPRTHNLAIIAAREAVKDAAEPPGAVIMGSTTGGMPLTENFIKSKNFNPDLYRYHATGSVADYIAGEVQCNGPVLTVSTACSSGALAIELAFEMLKCGIVKSVLAGGADALCRLTYHGFNSLQLLDPDGARPLDVSRKGMSLAEGAAMLLLSVHETAPKNAYAEILGAGLSCDAYHPASPHPDGNGAAEAMRTALENAGLMPGNIDYINLHGTGTIDNDASEAKAVHAVFGTSLPYISSVKGAFGHTLGAAGAIEAALSAISVTDGIIPANTGLSSPDPAINLVPVAKPLNKEVNIVLSNSFGFGGNNASVVIGRTGITAKNIINRQRKPFSVSGKACLTGSGDLNETMEALKNNGICKGLIDIDKASAVFPKGKIRRLKRLPRMVLSLAAKACEAAGNVNPLSIFFGTGWGALSDTYDFLDKLFESGEQFPSPTDFIGSVHNAPAGQAAIWFGATGANVTTTGGDYSFEQALLSASLVPRKMNEPVLLIGADEYHEVLSNALDMSACMDKIPADGGSAFLLNEDDGKPGLKIYISFFGSGRNNKQVISDFIANIGGAEKINSTYGAVFAGIPLSMKKRSEEQLVELRSQLKFEIPVIDYRKFTGEFASASAVASAIALDSVNTGKIPGLGGSQEINLNNKGILVLGLGEYVTAVEVFKIKATV